MLFKRKKRKSFWSHVQNLFWPSMGWRRTFDYIKHRILRLPASNHSVALGLAIGCAISWTPTMPVQILQCFLLCLLLRGNFFSSIVGTIIGNPWTFNFLFFTSYKIGASIISILGFGEILNVSVTYFNVFPIGIYAHPQAVMIPTVLGGYLLAILTSPFLYYGFYYLIKVERAARVKVAGKVHEIIDHRREVKEQKNKQGKK